MSLDMLKMLFTYGITIAILAGGFYALVIYPYELAELVKGAILGFMGASIAFVYGDQAATRTAGQQQKAFDAGVQTPMPPVEGGQG